MPDLTFLSNSEMASIGLSQADRDAFISARIRFGAIDSAKAIDRVTKELSPNGAKAFKGYVKAQGMVATTPASPFNFLRLILVPSPLMLSQPGMRLVVGFRRQTEQAHYEVPFDFTMGGINEIELYDVSLDHLIVYRVLTASGDLVVERVLSPLRDQRGELTVNTWSAVPPISPNETLRANASALDARLVIDTLRPAAITSKPAPVSPVFERNGRFAVIGQPDFGFGGYALSVGLATPDLLTTIAASLDTSGGTVAAQVRFAPGDLRFATLAAALPLVAVELDYAGTFHTRQEAQALNKVAGWIWVLTGPDTVVGFRPDPAPSGPAPEALIFLPPNLSAQPNQGGLPQDVSEATLLARPDLFSDDPGSSCKPFSNPGRILGEKRFRTVLRVTQPQVARAGSTPIRYEDQDKRTVDFPRVGVDPENPVEYEADPSRFQAQSVALGHIIEHVVRYRSNGYSLGNIAHSLTLAPREKRRIMKVDFTRSERASRTEGTSTGDEVMDSLDSQRDYDNAVSGELSEWSRGSSQSSAVGAAGGAGGIIPGAPVVIGGGISGGASQSSATQSSRRESAARENQRLRDAIRRYGQSLRNLESTVITEVSQSETVTGVSEVVQNINYTRALTIVYYEILRHLRVDTEVGAVSECVFVPMPIRPFSDSRISRHRKVLARFARGWLERSVFRCFDDIQANFAGSEIPAGEQRNQPLTRLSGSLTMTMGINMPVGGAPSGPATNDSETQLHKTADALEIAWQPYADLLPMPVQVLAEMLARTRSAPAETDKLFRTQIAPAMARAFVEHLTLGGPQKVERIDFTPVSAYKRGQPFQVDFDVTVDGTLTRRHLETLTLKIDPEFSLPPGSYLNVTSATISYSTNHYVGRASQVGGKRDLLVTTTGAPDNGGAALSFPPSSDDLLNLRERLNEGYAELKNTLEANTFRYHKAIWLGIDADELYALLDGYAISETDGRSLATVIERRPIGVLGNSLVFATRTDWPLDPLYKSFAELKAHYVSGLPPANPIRVSLPTSGLYARAHMDECIAAEEHDGSFDWVFASTEPELADFPSGMFDSRRSEPQGLTPTALPNTIINLQNAPAAPAPNGLASTLTTLGTDAFRDITGLAGTQENLRAAMSNATSLASTAMTQAVAAQAAQLASDSRAGKDLKSFAAATQKAVGRGQMSPEAGQKAVEEMAARKGGGGQGGGGDDLHNQAIRELVSSASNADGFQFASTNAGGDRVELAANKAGAKKEVEGDELVEKIVGLSEKAVATSLSALRTWVSEPNEPFANLLQDALLEEAKKELKAAGANLVKENIPIGSALIVGVKLAVAFARGAGDELIRTNERLRRTYDRELGLILRSEEMTEESIEALRELSAYQLNAVEELNGIFRAGLDAVFSEVFDEVADGIGKVFSDNKKTIIKQLAKENELFSVFNGGVGAALESERTALLGKILGFFVKAFVAQLPKSRLQNGLMTVMGNVRGTTSVPSELFAGLCMAVIDAETGALKVALGANVPEVKKLFLEEAKKLMDAGQILPVRPSTSSAIEIHPTEVLLPQSLIGQISALSGTLDKVTLEMKSAVDAFIAYKEGQEQLLKHRVGLQLANVRRGRSRSQAASIVVDDSNRTRDDVARAFVKLEEVIVRLAHNAGDTRLDDATVRRSFIRDTLDGLFQFDGWGWDEFSSGSEPFERPENILPHAARVATETEL